MILRPYGIGELVGIENPDLIMSLGIGVYALMYLLQRPRKLAADAALAA